MDVSSAGAGLFHEVIGSGAPTLVMHGGLGWDHTYLRPWLDPLASRHRVVFYDHRGNGRSDPHVDPDTLDHRRWVDDAEALRLALGLGSTIIFGHSYGGYLALEYALRYPESLSGLILSNTAPVVDFWDAIMANARRKGTPAQVEAITSGLSAPMADDQTFRGLIETILSLYFYEYRPEIGERLLSRMTCRVAPFNRAFFGGCLAGFDVRDRLGGIRVPTLVLGGGDDWIVPAEHGADRLAAAIPGAALRIFAKSGHLPFVEEQDEFVDTVHTWWAEAGQGHRA